MQKKVSASKHPLHEVNYLHRNIIDQLSNIPFALRSGL